MYMYFEDHYVVFRNLLFLHELVKLGPVYVTVFFKVDFLWFKHGNHGVGLLGCGFQELLAIHLLARTCPGNIENIGWQIVKTYIAKPEAYLDESNE